MAERMQTICIICANGNDLPEGEHCPACYREGKAFGLGAAVIRARGRSEPPIIPVMFDGDGEDVKVLTRDNVHEWAREHGGPIESESIKITDNMIEAGLAVHIANDPDTYAEDRRQIVKSIYFAMEAVRRLELMAEKFDRIR